MKTTKMLKYEDEFIEYLQKTKGFSGMSYDEILHTSSGKMNRLSLGISEERAEELVHKLNLIEQM
jgi:hypothetical protein